MAETVLVTLSSWWDRLLIAADSFPLLPQPVSAKIDAKVNDEIIIDFFYVAAHFDMKFWMW